MNRYHAHPMDEPEPEPVAIPEMTLAEWAVALAGGIVAVTVAWVVVVVVIAEWG